MYLHAKLLEIRKVQGFTQFNNIKYCPATENTSQLG